MPKLLSLLNQDEVQTTAVIPSESGNVAEEYLQAVGNICINYSQTSAMLIACKWVPFLIFIQDTNVQIFLFNDCPEQDKRKENGEKKGYYTVNKAQGGTNEGISWQQLYVFSVRGTFFFSAVFPNTPVPLVFCMQMKKGSQKEYTNDSSHFCALLVYIFSCRSWPVEKLCMSYLFIASSELCCLSLTTFQKQVHGEQSYLLYPSPLITIIIFFNFLFSVFFTVFVSLELYWL